MSIGAGALSSWVDMSLKSYEKRKRDSLCRVLFTAPQPAPVVDAEPVAYTDLEELDMLKSRNQCHAEFWLKPHGFGRDIPLYDRQQPAPVVVLPPEPTESDCPEHIAAPFSWVCGAGWMRDRLLEMGFKSADGEGE